MTILEKNNTQPINECRNVEYTLWLEHTEKYNYINAYNLAYLSRLAYTNVDINENHKALTYDFLGFINRAKVTRWSCTLGKDWNNIKTTRMVDDKETQVSDMIFIPFITLVDFKKGIQYASYVDNKKTSTTALFYTDEERAVIAVRGTFEKADMLIDADAQQVIPEVPDVKIQGKLHQGFYTQALAIIREQNFRNFVTNISNKKLFVTGHSLGGAVATILSAYLSERGLKPLLYTYGSPRVGDVNFVKAYNDKFVHFRHVNDGDTVPGVPGRYTEGNFITMLIGKWDDNGEHLTGFHALINLTGDLYTHHGNLCQFISDKTHVVMLPFFYNEITQISLKEKGIKEIKYKLDRMHGLSNPSMHSMDKYLSNIEKTIIEMYRFYRNKSVEIPYSREYSDIRLFQDFIDEQIAKTENEIQLLQSSLYQNLCKYLFLR